MTSMFLKTGIPLFILIVAGSASAQIFKCTDKDGHVTYSNLQNKGCTKMAVEAPNTSPAPKAGGKSATPTPAGFPRVDAGAQKTRDDERRALLGDELAKEQKALDEARKKLAEQEAIINPEERNAIGGHGQGQGINQAKVEERLKPFRADVQLHERNVAALQKELGTR